MEVKNVTSLVKKIKQDKELQSDFNKDPMGFLEKVNDGNPMGNKTVFLTIVIIVGCVLMTAIVLGGMIIFGAENNQTAKVPEFLVAMGSTALGALVGLLSPSPTTTK